MSRSATEYAPITPDGLNDSWQITGDPSAPTALVRGDRSIVLDPTKVEVKLLHGRGCVWSKKRNEPAHNVIRLLYPELPMNVLDLEVISYLIDFVVEPSPPITVDELMALKHIYTDSVFNPLVAAMAKQLGLSVCMPVPTHMKALVDEFRYSDRPLVFVNSSRGTKILQLANENLFLTHECYLSPNGSKQKGRMCFPFPSLVDSSWSALHSPTIWFFSLIDKEGAIHPDDFEKRVTLLGVVNAFIICPKIKRSTVRALVAKIGALYTNQVLPAAQSRIGVFFGSKYADPGGSEIVKSMSEVSKVRLWDTQASDVLMSAGNFTRIVLRTSEGRCANRDVIACELVKFKQLDFHVELKFQAIKEVGKALPADVAQKLKGKKDRPDGLLDKAIVTSIADKAVEQFNKNGLVSRSVGLTEIYGTGIVLLIGTWGEKQTPFPRILCGQVGEDDPTASPEDVAGTAIFLSEQRLTGIPVDSVDVVFNWFLYERARARTKILLHYDAKGPVVKGNLLSASGPMSKVASSPVLAGRRLMTCVPFSKIEGTIACWFFVCEGHVQHLPPTVLANAFVLSDLTH